MGHSKRYLSGIRLMVQAAFSFSVMAVCVKAVSHSIPSLEIVFFRSLIGTAMILTIMIRKRTPLLGHNRIPMTVRAVSGFIALTLHFYTIAHMHLGTAIMLNYTAPIFVAILAMIFLQERPSGLLLGMIVLAFAGVTLLVEGSLSGWDLPTLLGLISAIFAAIAYVAIRFVKHRESPLTIIFYFTGISTIGSLFYLPFGFKWPDFYGWLALTGVGIGSFYGQLWMTIALRRAPASLISPFSYLTPILSFLYGFVFWDERVSGISLTGVGLIILAGSLISYFETKTGKSKKFFKKA